MRQRHPRRQRWSRGTSSPPEPAGPAQRSLGRLGATEVSGCPQWDRTPQRGRITLAPQQGKLATCRASRQRCPHHVPFAKSQLRYSTVHVIRLLKQGICNLCFPAMGTVHRVNPRDFLFHRYPVAGAVAALTAGDVLV